MLALLFLLLLMPIKAYGQTTWETSPPPPVPLDNNSLSWNSTAHLLQYGSGGTWVNQAVGSGSPPAGAIGNLQVNGNGTSFGAFAGSACPANQVAISDNASGAFACTTISSTYVNNSIALTGTDINTSNQVTATHLAAALPASQGGTGIISPTQFSLLYANGASAFGTLLLTSDQLITGVTGGAPVALNITNCGDSTHALAYSTSSHLFSCQAISGTGGTGSATTGQILWDNGGAVAGIGGTGIPVLQGTSTPILLAGNTLASHNFANSINASGVISGAQPGAADIAAGTFSGAFTFGTAPTMSGANITAATIPNASLVTTPVTSVTGTAPIVSSGGTTPAISISGVTAEQGNGAKLQLSTGTTTTNDCVKYDANGNTVDAGGACVTSTFITAMAATGAMTNYGGL